MQIYPDRDEYEALQERAFERLNRHSNYEAFQKAVDVGLKHQAQLRKLTKLNPKDFEYSTFENGMARPRG